MSISVRAAHEPCGCGDQGLPPPRRGGCRDQAALRDAREHHLLVVRQPGVSDDEQVVREPLRQCRRCSPVPTRTQSKVYVSNSRPDGIHRRRQIVFHMDHVFYHAADGMYFLRHRYPQIRHGFEVPQRTSYARLPDALRDRTRGIKIPIASTTPAITRAGRTPKERHPNRRARGSRWCGRSGDRQFAVALAADDGGLRGRRTDDRRQLIKDLWILPPPSIATSPMFTAGRRAIS